jgi:hypothetical protein
MDWSRNIKKAVVVMLAVTASNLKPARYSPDSSVAKCRLTALSIALFWFSFSGSDLCDRLLEANGSGAVSISMLALIQVEKYPYERKQKERNQV